MDDIPLTTLIAALVVLVALSAFFSAAEIALMTINRYRLRHLADSGHTGARLASRLLERPDRLIGLILLASNGINALFSAVTTVVVFRLLGEKEGSIAVATLVITLVVLILTDLAPKTVAAIHPERIALPSAYILRPLLKLCYPLVWVINGLANGLLRLLGVGLKARGKEQLSPEELRVIVAEAGVLIPEAHQEMLLAILDLENVTVDDVMVPRGDIDGLNLDDAWEGLLAQIAESRYTRLPVYRGDLDGVIGFLHLRHVVQALRGGELDRERLESLCHEPYFIPTGTSLNTQLLNFRKARRRTGLVVGEYGDVIGLVTLEDVIEEIVGEFRQDSPWRGHDIRPQGDGSFLLDGGVSLRELNRKLDWALPTDGPKTLNGLITEYLEDIPQAGTSLRLKGYQMEVLRTRDNAVHLVRVRPPQTPAEG